MLPHTQWIHSLQTPNLLEHQRWVLLWLLHTENPYTIKTNSKGWQKTAYAHTHTSARTNTHITYHASFNPRCLRESEGNSTAERNSWTWTTRNRICVGLSAPPERSREKMKDNRMKNDHENKRKSSIQKTSSDSIGKNKQRRQSKLLIINQQTSSSEG